MGARQKLNQAVMNALLIIAAIAGIASESFTIFLGCLVVLILLAVHAGDIRLNSKQPGTEDLPPNQRRHSPRRR